MSLSSFFNPTEKESANRRMNTFGTKNKAVVGGLIVAGAAAAAAAPAFIVGGGLKRAATGFAGLSFGKQAAITLGAPIVASAVIGNPGSVPKVAGNLGNVYSNVLKTANNPSKENIKALATENPLTVTALGTGAAFALGGAGLIGSAINTQTTRANTAAINRGNELISNTPSLPVQLSEKKEKKQKSADMVSSVPLTPETIPLGKEVSPGTGTKTPRRSRTRAGEYIRNTVKVNVFNQNRLRG